MDYEIITENVAYQLKNGCDLGYIYDTLSFDLDLGKMTDEDLQVDYVDLASKAFWMQYDDFDSKQGGYNTGRAVMVVLSRLVLEIQRREFAKYLRERKGQDNE